MRWPRGCGSLALMIGITALGGCASGSVHKHPAGVPVEARPTPPQPESQGSGTPQAASPRRTSSGGPSLEGVARLSRVISDTTAAGEALRRCAGRKLLADQEGVRDATIQKLADARAALDAGDLVRAQSLAREARQLAASINCR